MGPTTKGGGRSGREGRKGVGDEGRVEVGRRERPTPFRLSGYATAYRRLVANTAGHVKVAEINSTFLL